MTEEKDSFMSPTSHLSGRPEVKDRQLSPAFIPAPSPRAATPASQHHAVKVSLAPLPEFGTDVERWKRHQRVALRYPMIPLWMLDIIFRIAEPPICARYGAPDSGRPYVILGIFYKGDTIPKERYVDFRTESQMFWRIWWAVSVLRGPLAMFSLKDVRHFQVYKCNWDTGSHEGVELDKGDKHKMLLFQFAYQSWRFQHDAGKLWLQWLQTSLNNDITNPTGGPIDHSLALEVVLGWSAKRITVATIIPILLSLAIGLYLQIPNFYDLNTIQTAWTVASYVVTSAALLAALLGFATNAST